MIIYFPARVKFLALLVREILGGKMGTNYKRFTSRKARRRAIEEKWLFSAGVTRTAKGAARAGEVKARTSR